MFSLCFAVTMPHPKRHPRGWPLQMPHRHRQRSHQTDRAPESDAAMVRFSFTIDLTRSAGEDGVGEIGIIAWASRGRSRHPWQCSSPSPMTWFATARLRDPVLAKTLCIGPVCLLSSNLRTSQASLGPVRRSKWLVDTSRVEPVLVSNQTRDGAVFCLCFLMTRKGTAPAV